MFALYIDFGQCFGRIPHRKLWRAPRKRGLPKKFVRHLRDLYTNTRCKARSEHLHGDWFPVACGVRQGSVEGPILANIHIVGGIFAAARESVTLVAAILRKLSAAQSFFLSHRVVRESLFPSVSFSSRFLEVFDRFVDLAVDIREVRIDLVVPHQSIRFGRMVLLF